MVRSISDYFQFRFFLEFIHTLYVYKYQATSVFLFNQALGEGGLGAGTPLYIAADIFFN